MVMGQDRPAASLRGLTSREPLNARFPPLRHARLRLALRRAGFDTIRGEGCLPRNCRSRGPMVMGQDLPAASLRRRGSRESPPHPFLKPWGTLLRDLRLCWRAFDIGAADVCREIGRRLEERRRVREDSAIGRDELDNELASPSVTGQHETQIADLVGFQVHRSRHRAVQTTARCLVEAPHGDDAAGGHCISTVSAIGRFMSRRPQLRA